MVCGKDGSEFFRQGWAKKPVWFASYGIGPTRTMGAWVEVSHDKQGIIWNKAISPFDVHLIELKTKKSKLKTEEIYNEFRELNIDVLWDDRDVSAGVKFTDADLIGIPVRIVVSEKTKNKVEWRERGKGKEELMTIDKAVQGLKDNR